MESDNVGLVICLTLFIVIGLNAAIYAAVSRGGWFWQINSLRHTARRMKKPWEHEDQDLEELSRLVSDLKDRRSNDSDEGKQ